MMRLLLQISLFSTFLFTLVSQAAFAAVGDFDTKAEFAYVVDYNTGDVLLDKGGDELMHPASMTKLMTAYLVFDALKQGNLTMDTMLPVSKNAWSKQGSKMFVQAGEYVSVRDLIRGVIIQSGNDACIVLAEGMAGSEEAFAKDMNAMAKKLGMNHSHFENSTGWPGETHMVSAHDLAILATRLINDFPEYLYLYSTEEFTYNGIKQQNRNKLLGKGIGADGLKTGFTDQSGYGMVATAKQEGRRVVAVLNGLKSANERISEAEKLLLYGFRDFKIVTLFKAGETVDSADVWFGDKASVPLVLEKDIEFTVSKRVSQQLQNTEINVVYNSPWPAPIKKGTHIANLVIKKDGKIMEEYPLVAGEDVEKASLASRVWSALKYYTGT